eukprot:scaffold20352_cov28-Tisochrysis_lutea.AAC.10
MGLACGSGVAAESQRGLARSSPIAGAHHLARALGETREVSQGRERERGVWVWAPGRTAVERAWERA